MYEDLDTTCDGLFLIIDTARHGGWVVDTEEIITHIETCPECMEHNEVPARS